MLAGVLKTKFVETITSVERKLKRNPNHPERAKLLKELKAAKEGLSTLQEVCGDDATERISRELG